MGAAIPKTEPLTNLLHWHHERFKMGRGRETRVGNLVIRGQEAYARDSQGGGKQEKQEKNVPNYIYFVLQKVQRP